MSGADGVARAEVRPGVFLDGAGALFLTGEGLLVVADLHWGYSASHRVAGNLLPQWGDAELARRLRDLLARWPVRRFLWLGDSLHTLAGRSAAEAFLASLPPSLDTVVLAGNHDRAWDRARPGPWDIPGFRFHHGDQATAVPEGAVEVAGHVHPAVVLNDGAGGRARVPALVDGPRRLLLPAFSPWAAGAGWNGRLLPDERLWVVSPRRVFPLPPDHPLVQPCEPKRRGHRPPSP